MSDKGWCIYEAMGHRKLAGYVTDDGGRDRVDVYLEDPEDVLEDGQVVRTAADPVATQWYGPSALYCATGVTKAVALAYARSNALAAPVGRWELPPPKPNDEDDIAAAYADDEEPDDDEGDDPDAAYATPVEAHDLSEHDARIREWVEQNRTDAWIAHQLEVRLFDVANHRQASGIPENDAQSKDIPF